MAEETPPRPFFLVREEVNRLFQEIIHQPWGGHRPSVPSGWQPRVDMCETSEAFIVEVELPGVQREDVGIAVHDDTLYITGERHTNSARQDRNYYRVERSYGRFERQLRLPGTVVQEAIRAEFDSGILTVTLPKRRQH